MEELFADLRSKIVTSNPARRIGWPYWRLEAKSPWQIRRVRRLD
jgi:hypothetical protein